MSLIKTAMFFGDFLYFSSAVFNWGSTKTHLFQNSGTTKVLPVERDVKSQNVNFAKLGRMGGINRAQAFVPINTVC